MTLSGDLAALARQGVQLWVEDGKLRIRAPKGTVTPATREMLTARKDEIVELLRFQISPDQPKVQADQGTITGAVPLTPSQYSFFYRSYIHRFHRPLAIYMEVEDPMDPILLKQAVGSLLIHHDALRMRFRRERGIWHQMNLGQEEHEVFSHLDLSRVPVDEQNAAVIAAEREAMRSINITTGPMIRVILITRGSGRFSRVSLIIHHLIMDFYSLSILWQDLETAYVQLRASETIRLPAKTTSYKAWAERLTEYAGSTELSHEREYWYSLFRNRIGAPPQNYRHYRGPIGRGRTVQAVLTAEETRVVMQDIPAQQEVQGMAVILAALSQAYARWSGGPLLIDVFTHGRQPLFDDMSTARTVGLFALRYPLLVNLEGEVDPMAAIRTVHQKIKLTPHGGIGYGVLRDLACDPSLLHVQTPRITLNYRSLGQEIPSGNVLFSRTGHVARTSNACVPAKRLLQWTGSVHDGKLHLSFTYHGAIYSHATMERLASDTVEAIHSFIRSTQPPPECGAEQNGPSMERNRL